MERIGDLWVDFRNIDEPFGKLCKPRVVEECRVVVVDGVVIGLFSMLFWIKCCPRTRSFR